MNTEKRPKIDRDTSLDYVDGRGGIDRKNTQYGRERAAENSGVATGVIIGGILAFSIGIGVVVWAYANRDLSSTTQPENVGPITVPASPKPSAASTAPTKQTTVIERTIEKPAPPAEVEVIEVPKAVPVPVITPPAASTSAPATSTPAASSRSSSNEDRTAPPTNAPAPSNQAPSTHPIPESNSNSPALPNGGDEAR
jgi:outer membrane biosynthesis protein TonB